MDISSFDNKIAVAGQFRASEVKRFLATVHNRIAKRGYEHLVFDFANVSAAFESGIVPVLPILDKARREFGAEFELILPREANVATIFRNMNWAHFIDPVHHNLVAPFTQLYVPVKRYDSAQLQSAAVDSVMDVILNALPVLSRRQIQALEWAVNEITDNVLNHSNCESGGYFQAQIFRENQVVEFVVVDGGDGIPTTLGIHDHSVALEQAIREGVTRDKQTNAGNGLFGSFEIARLSKGLFSITSLCGNLYLTQQGEVRARRQDVPYSGTWVHASISCGDPALLEAALTFKGVRHEPAFDYVERRFEIGDDTFVVRMKDEAKSFGSREFGRLMYNKIMTLISIDPAKPVIFDFDEVPVISSSYADEVFGRLFLHLGPLTFGARVYFRNVSSTVITLVDRAILQRVANDVSRPEIQTL